MAHPKKQDWRFVDGSVDHVVVFGDSLSDIGQKWNQPAPASLVAFLPFLGCGHPVFSLPKWAY